MRGFVIYMKCVLVPRWSNHFNCCSPGHRILLVNSAVALYVLHSMLFILLVYLAKDNLYHLCVKNVSKSLQFVKL